MAEQGYRSTVPTVPTVPMRSDAGAPPCGDAIPHDREPARPLRPKRAPWSLVYGIVLVTFTTFVLLDTFVIPHGTSSTTTVGSAAALSATTTSTDAQTASDGGSSTAGTSGTSVSSDTSSTSGAATVTATSYSDANVQIALSTERVADTDVYVVDIQVSSVAYLKTAFAQATYGRNIKETTSSIAEDNGAILAINGDYYGFRDTGFVIRDGILYRSVADAGTDALVIGSDGSFSIVDESSTSAQELLDAGAWQVLSFGPALVEDGQISVGTNTEVGQSMSSNPRTAIGMVSPLHYVIVVSDGRTSASAGLSLYEVAQVMQEQGCTVAYNLDGGGSSTLWFNGQVVNNPTDGRSSGEREVSDIVYIGE